MKLIKEYLLLTIVATFIAPTLQAADTQLHFTPPETLSEMSGVVAEDLGMAFKTKLVRLGDGTLIALFGDGVDATKIVYDVKSTTERPARDVFVRTCASATDDCSLATNWSNLVNLSNTALLSSSTTDWQGVSGEPSAFFGDSDKPNISNGGANLVVTWTDKYCDGGVQGSVTYPELEGREVPFSCTWVTYSGNKGATWSTPVQLSDGSRDAKQDSSKVNSLGKSVVTWQEDPLGLQLGEGDGPGDGASGAKASPGTNIWYATTTNIETKWDAVTGKATAGKPSGFPFPAVSLTDNFVIPPVGVTVAGDEASEAVIAAASRPNVAIVGPKIVVAYEETKASAKADYGKFVRYHSFNYPDLTVDPPVFVQREAGCIISNPAENSRRVRFITQSDNQVNTAEGADTGLRLGIIWKQGNYSKGGPSDIVGRVGFKDLANTKSYGVDPSEMQPTVDEGCATSDYPTAIALANIPALNLSTNTPNATPADLLKDTESNNIENALAHRGAIVGNDLYIGYSYTADWDAAVNKHTATYDFWLRHFGTVMADGVPVGVWSSPKNISKLPTVQLTVREPRLVKMPYSSDPTANYNPNALVVAWGLQTNVTVPQDVDILYTRTFDQATTFEPVVRVANDFGNQRFESQLRPTPDGQTVYAVWNEVSQAATDAMIAKAVSGVITDENPYEGLYDPALEPVEPIDPVEPIESIDPVAPPASRGGRATLFSGLLLPVLIAVGLGLVGFVGFRRMKR